MLLSLLLACSGPSDDDDGSDRPDPTAETSTTAETGNTTATGTTGTTGTTGSTGDTGFVYPKGLHGHPPASFVGPNKDFEVFGHDGLNRHWWDLYDGVPTVLYLAADRGDNDSELIVDELVDLHGGFAVLGMKVVVDANGEYTSGVAQWMLETGSPFEIWGDVDGVLHSYYEMVGNRATRILDADGNVLLEYDSGKGEVIASVHVDDVLEDCNLLFGDP